MAHCVSLGFSWGTSANQKTVAPTTRLGVAGQRGRGERYQEPAKGGVQRTADSGQRAAGEQRTPRTPSSRKQRRSEGAVAGNQQGNGWRCSRVLGVGVMSRSERLWWLGGGGVDGDEGEGEAETLLGLGGFKFAMFARLQKPHVHLSPNHA
jgi:hypothetical protein